MDRSDKVQDSPQREEIRAEYDRLWADMQTADADKVRRMLERDRRQLLPWRQRLIETTKPLRTPLLWARGRGRRFLCRVYFYRVVGGVSRSARKEKVRGKGEGKRPLQSRLRQSGCLIFILGIFDILDIFEANGTR